MFYRNLFDVIERAFPCPARDQQAGRPGSRQGPLVHLNKLQKYLKISNWLKKGAHSVQTLHQREGEYVS